VSTDRLREAVRGFVRRRSRRPREVYATAAFGVGVTALHFGSTAIRLYARVWWWDVFVHALSGLGVAAAVYVLRPRLLGRPLALLVALPAVVLAVGAWFEVYERLFTDFWQPWSTAHYREDTLVDLVADWIGAVAFGAYATLRGGWRSRGGRRRQGG
jgi:hypothetical protein